MIVGVKVPDYFYVLALLGCPGKRTEKQLFILLLFCIRWSFCIWEFCIC